MADPMTMTRQEYDEYVTKGMLLGREYDWQTHTLWVCLPSGAFDELDADTIEPVEEKVALQRKEKLANTGYGTGWEGMVKWRRDHKRGIIRVSIPDPR